MVLVSRHCWEIIHRRRGKTNAVTAMAADCISDKFLKHFFHLPWCPHHACRRQSLSQPNPYTSPTFVPHRSMQQRVWQSSRWENFFLSMEIAVPKHIAINLHKNVTSNMSETYTSHNNTVQFLTFWAIVPTLNHPRWLHATSKRTNHSISVILKWFNIVKTSTRKQPVPLSLKEIKGFP